VYKSMDRRVAPIKRNLWYINIPLLILLLFVVSLVSGLFKYQIMAIGSGSMEPIIYRGDAIVFEKVKTEDDRNEIEEGTIIVFKHNGLYITHRVTKIEMVDGARIYQTKGDNNEKEDAFKVEDDDIVGVTRFKVKYIGFPTLWIQDLFNK
ncbi:MAG: signal peptidase I, partial [Bacilli bacterium]|nr:signal peptidase I [Bacilli bacterium]